LEAVRRGKVIDHGPFFHDSYFCIVAGCRDGISAAASISNCNAMETTKAKDLPHPIRRLP
jgi:hypothetical protein